MSKVVLVLTGPTGIGKTRVGIEVAKAFATSIISADSRQVYREIPIGTGAPTAEEQAIATHHLVGSKSIHDYYNAWEFEQEALAITTEQFKSHELLLLVGGSMMYVDVFCNGIDDLPTVDSQLRLDLQTKFEREGIESIRLLLKILDPVFYNIVDLQNPKRVIHAVEICLMTGKPYSSFLTRERKKRAFTIVKIGLTMDRARLYQQIDSRVINMIDNGLLTEARPLAPFKELNALNTVGYKELFAFFEDQHDLERAITLIQRNTRHYAKKQISWFKRDPDITWFNPDNVEGIIKHVNEAISRNNPGS